MEELAPVTFENTMQAASFGMSFILVPQEIGEKWHAQGHKRALATAQYKGKSNTFHCALQKRKGTYQIIFGSRVWKPLGLNNGDTFQLTLAVDKSKYQAPMCEELEAVLYSDPEAENIFNNLKPGLQRNIIYHVDYVKGEQKRVDKAIQIMDRLKMGITEFRQLTRKELQRD